ncbi:hypothetical protein C3489_10110 [Streptomyces sp. Ru71]|nr:hypothetical protein C3489_10110 [Streptomyces sp. Ru71]
MLAYFREMVQVLVDRCGISRAEAVARINATYGQDAGGLLIMRHELPEYWAYGAYYRPDDQDRLPTGDPAYDAAIDFTRLPLRPAPPRDSDCWTVGEEQEES